MIVIDTYLRILAKGFTLEKADQEPERFFINIVDENEIVEKIVKKTGRLDYYNRGSLVIQSDETIIMNYSTHDLISPLWWEYILAVKAYLDTGTGEVNFPDQPLSLFLEKGYADYLVLTKKGAHLKEKRYYVNEAEFLESFFIAARNFYSIIPKYSTEPFMSYTDYLNKELLIPFTGIPTSVSHL